MILSEKIRKAIKAFIGLPGIGPRGAARIAFFIMRADPDKRLAIKEALESLSDISVCPRCFFINANGSEFCHICRDSSRRHNEIIIVSKDTDVISLERAGTFKGRYLVLGDIPKTGRLSSDQSHRLKTLISYLESKHSGQAEEIIIALGATTLGDWGTSLIKKELSPFAKSITSLGRGLPTGAEIEFADPDTLSASLQNRK